VSCSHRHRLAVDMARDLDVCSKGARYPCSIPDTVV
jgi:hypothetical protein